MSAIKKRKKEKRRPRIRIVDWTMEPTIDFKLPDRRLSRDLLELLDSLGSEHPISQWLEVFRNPKAAFRRTFCRIRRAADGPLYNRQSDSFCAAEAIESLIASFQQYLNEFSLGLVVRKGMMSNQIHLQLRCQDGKVSREFRLLAALLAIARDGDMSLVRRCAVCGRWMHAHQADQPYHQKKCRQIAWQSKPEVKKQRREGRKRRYWEEKEKDRRALERARQHESTRGSQSSYKGRTSI